MRVLYRSSSQYLTRWLVVISLIPIRKLIVEKLIGRLIRVKIASYNYTSRASLLTSIPRLSSSYSSYPIII